MALNSRCVRQQEAPVRTRPSALFLIGTLSQTLTLRAAFSSSTYLRQQIPGPGRSSDDDLLIPLKWNNLLLHKQHKALALSTLARKIKVRLHEKKGNLTFKNYRKILIIRSICGVSTCRLFDNGTAQASSDAGPKLAGRESHCGDGKPAGPDRPLEKGDGGIKKDNLRRNVLRNHPF